MAAALYAYVRLLLFVGGVLAGIQIPGVLDAYRTSLEARLAESSRSLAPFQTDADRYFAGDMQILISHYRKGSDPVFQHGGDHIATMLARNLRLREALASFDRGVLHALFHFIYQPVEEIREGVFQGWAFEARLNTRGIGAGLGLGLASSFTGEMLLRGSFFFLRRTVRRRRTT